MAFNHEDELYYANGDASEFGMLEWSDLAEGWIFTNGRTGERNWCHESLLVKYLIQRDYQLKKDIEPPASSHDTANTTCLFLSPIHQVNR